MKGTGIDLNGLQTLLVIVRMGGFSAAARQLGVPTNRLTRQIQRLEESLGVRLLQRTTRKLSLTTAGQSLVDQAEPAMQTLESSWQQISTQASAPCGHLRIAAPIDFLTLMQSQLMAHFLKLHPAISLEIILSDDQVDLFSTGIDLAVRAGPIHDENVIAQRLISSHRILVASPAFIEQHGLPQQVCELANYPCLTMQSKDGHAKWALANEDMVQVTVQVPTRFTVNGMGPLVNAAKVGLGIALLPDHLIAQDLAAGHLVHLLPNYHYDGGGVYLVYSSRKHPRAALRILLDFLQTLTQNIPAAALYHK
jgi:DNA-binding transcriptional LysR family regulator